MEKHILYQKVNTYMIVCHDCGYTGIGYSDNPECPNCKHSNPAVAIREKDRTEKEVAIYKKINKGGK